MFLIEAFLIDHTECMLSGTSSIKNLELFCFCAVCVIGNVFHFENKKKNRFFLKTAADRKNGGGCNFSLPPIQTCLKLERENKRINKCNTADTPLQKGSNVSLKKVAPSVKNTSI